MSLIHPMSFAIASALLAATVIALLRKRRISFSMLFGGACLAIAAGGPTITRHPPRGVTVMLDVSSSTRGALFHSRSVLRHRVAELVGATPLRWIEFADRNRALPINAAVDAIAEMPGDQTIFNPPPARPVLLFSDGNFDLPAKLPAVYPVIDPLLSDADDSAIESIAVDGDRASGIVRSLRPVMTQWDGTSRADAVRVGAGATIVDGGMMTASSIEARVLSHDRWPENDSLSAEAPPPEKLVRWWVRADSPADAPGGWIALAADRLPVDPADDLGVSMIVLANVPASALDTSQQQALFRYVHDLGGGLLITGGDHAFGAGGYTGSILDLLSPLTGYPPRPRRLWIVLIDRSGSMSAETADGTRLARAVDAAGRLMPKLPPNDRLSVGAFAAGLRWWLQDAKVADAAGSSIAPSNLEATGPTNLQSAIEQILSRVPAALPTELILLSDGDAVIDNPISLASRLRQKQIRVDLLALTDAPPAAGVSQLVQATGGQTMRSADVHNWATDLQALASSTSFDPVRTDVGTVRYLAGANLPDRNIANWNPTWPRAGAIEETQAKQNVDQQAVPRAARWNFGNGAVGAIAFAPDGLEIAAFQRWLAVPAADSAIHVGWDNPDPVTVTIDAVRDRVFLNELHPTLELIDLAESADVANHAPPPTPLPIPLIAPGRYRISLPSPRRQTLAIVRDGETILDRRMLAGRYAAEFDRIGNNLPALTRLAERSGGAVIAPDRHQPIDFRWPAKQTSLTGDKAIHGAASLALACWVRRT